MANPHPKLHPENLKPIKKGDPTAKDKQRKGGLKSQEVQAHKKTMREWALLFGSMPMKDGKIGIPTNASEIKDSNMTLDAAIIAAMYSKAAKGDVRAAEFLAKLKEQLAEEVTVKVDPLSEASSDDLIALYQATRPKDKK